MTSHHYIAIILIAQFAAYGQQQNARQRAQGNL